MLNVTPTLISTGATSQTIKTVWTLASTDTPVVSSGYSTFTIEIRWDPTVATVLASSVKLIGNSAAGDVVIFDTTALSSGILRAAGFAGAGSSFAGTSPVMTFSFSESSLNAVNFSVTQEDFNGTSYLNKSTNLYTVSLSGSGPTAPVIPVVQTYNPAQGSTVSSLSASITLTFNEAVMATPNGVGTIQLRTGSATGPLVQSFSLTNTAQLNFAGTTLTVTPSSPLVNNTTYFLVIAPGAIQDIAGDAFAGTTTYSFGVNSSGTSGTPTPTPTPTPTATPTPTVGNAPQVLTFSPALGATTSNLSTPIVVNFNENVLPGTGNIQIFANSATSGQLVSTINVATSSSVIFSGSSLTIIPPQSFSAATTYYVVFPSGSVQDSAGNAYAGTNTYEFQTLSNVTPTPTTGGGNNAPTGTLVAATQSQLLSAAALQSNLPEVTNTSLISQYKLGNLTVLLAQNNGTNINDILSNATDPISGVINDSGMNLSLTGPSNVGLKMQSPSGPGDIINGSIFVNNLINVAFPGNQISSTAMLYKASIQGGLATIGLQPAAASVSATKVFNFTGSATAPIQIKENNTQTDLAVLNLNAMQSATTVQVNNLSNVLVMGAGTVTNAGTKAMNLIGDTSNQALVGGPGNDFIGGGGGVDTLTGGGGIDTFYFGAPGWVTITDFTTNDKMMFNMSGVKTFQDLCNSVTNVIDNVQGVTYTINGNLQISIVGYHASSNWSAVTFTFV